METPNFPAPQETQGAATIPPYEDVGVRYQGFSKRLATGNTYAVTPQTPVFINGYVNNSTAVIPIYTVPPNKRLFISSIQIECSVGNQNTVVGDSTGGMITAFFTTAQLNFNMPLPVAVEFKGTVTIQNGSTGFSTSNYLTGWLEDV
jgi:hypothetical protein